MTPKKIFTTVTSMNPRPRKELDTSTYEGRFAARLKMLREKAGLSVDTLAEVTEFPRQTLYDWESTKSSPPVKHLPKLAESLGVSIRALLPPE